MATDVETKVTPSAGLGTFALRDFEKGEVVIQDEPFAVLTAPLPDLPAEAAKQPSASVDAGDLSRCLASLKKLRQALKELCATIVGYQPSDPKAYWAAVGKLSSPCLESSHPVIKEVVAICKFLALQAAPTKLLNHWPDKSAAAVARTVLTWSQPEMRSLPRCLRS
eukprot:TRINITY_DN38231_c0_g1_i1.p2 TRINITY_DN38231_c0_g1~~TRINITY_DN38231_c0_g1_i1.p2  ORF type:complete len:166 (+),score=38.44 TRINITY_DN38231_c0_g1_i1:144-641(+)